MSDIKEILKEKLEKEKKINFEITIDEVLQLQSALMTKWAMQQKDLAYYEGEFNSPKKPYSISSFGVHLKDIVGKEKQEHFRYNINSIRQKIQETELFIDKVNNLASKILGE